MEVGETWFHTVQDDQGPAVWLALLGFPVASDMSLAKRDSYELVDVRASLIGEKLSLSFGVEMLQMKITLLKLFERLNLVDHLFMRRRIQLMD